MVNGVLKVKRHLKRLSRILVCIVDFVNVGGFCSLGAWLGEQGFFKA